MDMRTRRRQLVIFWGTIVLGVGLPLVVMIAIELIRNGKGVLQSVGSTMLFYFEDFSGLGFFYWIGHGLLFLLLAILVKAKLAERGNGYEDYILRLTEAIGAWTLTVGFSLLANLSILFSVSSTAVLGYIFVPLYGIPVILLGYGCGWLVGRLILWIRSGSRQL